MPGLFEEQAGQNDCSSINKGVSLEDEIELQLVTEVCVGL